MKSNYKFSTRFGRWLHCLFRRHTDVTYADSKVIIYGCRECVAEANATIAKLMSRKDSR